MGAGEGYFEAAWSEEKVVKVPLAIPLHIASVSSDVSRSGGEQTALAPLRLLGASSRVVLDDEGTVKVWFF